MSSAMVVESTETVSDSNAPVPPKKSRTVTTKTVKEKVAFLPKPPGWKVQPGPFCSYWSKTNKEYPNRLLAYVYRRWPIISKEPKYIGVESTPLAPKGDPEELKEEMAHRYGSGDYKLILADSGTNKGVCQTVIVVRDTDRPPVIEKLEHIVLDDPANRSFIEGLRARGVRLPGETGYLEKEREEEDAAMQAGAVEKLTDTVENLTDKMMEMAERGSTRQPPAPPPQRPLDAEAASIGMRIVQQAAEAGQTIINASVEKATELAGQRSDPMTVVREVTTLVKELTPPKDDGGLIREVLNIQATTMDRIMGMQAAELERTRAEVDRLRNTPPPTAPIVAAAGQPQQQGGLLQQLKELRTAKDELEGLFGGGGDDEKGGGGSSSGWLQHMPGMLTAATALFSLGATIAHNIAVARSGQGTPIAPGPAPQPQINPEVTGTQQVLDSQDGGANMQATLAEYHRYLALIERPMLTHLADGRSGADFADFIMDLEGEQGRLRYEAIREAGRDSLVMLLQSYPAPGPGQASLWQRLTLNPQRFEQFLLEFFTHDEIREQEEREEQEREARGARPKVVVTRPAGTPPNPGPSGPAA